MTVQTWLWAGFALAVAGMLAVDLGILQRKAHVVSLREAAVWSLVWVSLALLFCGVVGFFLGREKAMLFLAGYMLEKSLSVDNLFVFVLIFHYFSIPPEHQSRVLHWGILGAVLMRFVFIFAGVSLLEASHLVFYAFGAILLWTGGKMLFHGEDSAPRPGQNPALKLLHRFLPVAPSLHGQSFLVRISGRLHATPLLAALVVVEASDLLFAVDSIPAALGVTSDLFVVYTSNIFAIMGLRALYFLLAGTMTQFRHLKTGISLALCFVGVKMLARDVLHMPVSWSLGAIALLLGGSMAASMLPERRKT